MKLLIWQGAGALLLVCALSGCGKGHAPAAEQKVQSEPSARTKEASAAKKEAPATEENEKGKLVLSADIARTAGISVAPLQEQDSAEQIVVTASIGANQDRFAHIAPRVAGRIVKVSGNLGDKVRAGQMLAVIDSIEVGEAQSSYVQASSEHELAKAGAERAEKLFADQIIPQKDYLRAKGDFEKAKAILRAAADKRQALGIAGKSSPSANVSTFAVASPFSGTLVEKKAVLGELAQPDKMLFAVADLSNVWIEGNLYEKDIAKVHVGAQALITLAAYPGETFAGKVAYISSGMDKESHTIKARVEVPNPDGKLKLDMFATAAISTMGTSKRLLLPEQAVVLIQGQPTVFVQEKGGFEARAIEVGEKLRGKVVVKSGVAAGENVVTAGAYALKAKMLKSQIGDAD
ncbi:efflux RND transporter periplasmic adaptor subunit [Undibacterium sp. Jales W-56]|uniref:efflux RND transporter periplasmic adaptor subunit n=1 Tax=Undibacterium sp. Jales W-56 TaxID=2897325 RepID=UPI0021D05FE4|nr:efflux RND transporter periplasmic adaptor subunit [Undibacterium sp. Jales W-56]MCU6435303.1 efflux RND transporter periplasmic adaptor subunit [Undibacterium sp. Jales W-56]